MGNPYTSVSATGYNANPPSDDGSQTEANRITWAKFKTKLVDVVKTQADGINTNTNAAFGKVSGGITSTAISYQVVSTDQGKKIVATASGITITSPDAVDVGSPFKFSVLNKTTGVVAFDGSGSQTVDGEASVLIPAGAGLDVDTDGANWFTSGKNFRLGVLPRGYIDGCIVSNGTDATNDINIAAGVCRDSTNSVDITVAAMAGKQLDANWAPGAAAGMRNSAAGITDTTYHIYAVAKLDGTQDIYAHTSTTAATVLAALQAESGGADYVYARLIMSVVRSGATILAFHQYPSGVVLLDTPVKDGNSIGPDTTERTLVLASVPTGIALEAIFNGWWAAADTVLLNFYPVNQSYSPTVSSGPGSAGGSISGSGVATTGSAIPTQRVMTNTAASIHYRATGTGTAQIWTLGFVHPRGRDA